MTAPGRIDDPWGTASPTPRGAPWPPRRDVQLADGVGEEDVQAWTQTASLLHSDGDAMDIATIDGRIVGVRGRTEDRVNRGRLGPKDLFGWQANASPDRLLTPTVAGRPASWQEAMGAVADRCRTLLAEYGPTSIGFYTSGQLFAEEYWTLATIARAGIGTPHLDGNTRLCTATAGEALKESFGSDGQPGSYEDVHHCDALALWGHNVAETQPVLWMRMRDRLLGPDRPRLLVVDPRRTVPARVADVHLALRPGTNLPLLLGLQHLLIARGWVDRAYVDAHTVGGADLEAAVAPWTPERTASACGLTVAEVEAAAELLGTCEALMSTVLQGVYQAPQATATACQINNVHLLRGMLGRPGAGLLQMNGQPSAQNTRETGANGDLPGFRNWANLDHVQELAEVWNVDPSVIPHDGPPTDAMEIFRRCEEGSIRFLWISATNPAVSLPELARIRAILGQERLFVVAQDIFPTETTALADVVLPAATWGEKTGIFTNADRTAHLSEQAVDPPGEARSDLEIFVDFAGRMGLKDRDGRPLVTWREPEEAYRAWQRCSAGRPCDYTAISYEDLRGASGVQWGGDRLYADGRFPWAHPDACETYTKDLVTGEPVGAEGYRARNPEGRAMLRAATHVPPREPATPDHPLLLITGRTVYHFHTRTKTGRVPELQAAAPDVWVELSPADAAARGIAEGDVVRVTSRRGTVEAPARISGVREGAVFVPFHYGYWDAPGRGHERAANELVRTDWDAVSKQPLFKAGAVTVTRVRAGSGPAPAPMGTASAPEAAIG
ncbi:molybdopterin-dependent oxidoreductase [Paraconexibacter antarcticus]|uniref:Molybdopterin-dependent oxidoreductase n=1 Tax=Paraconexibacter antarcticus TaxID=2949664 RepID=A0ABY5DVR9_9ACTN|nr:molybdopterin-dependent oxidoreductase [Paraconexibacter antarcticus]UTI66108.1 molybdopterin-dependent oxidoreductase [Paraconexibacter antarcticus]